MVSDSLSLIQVTQTCLILWGWERTELSVLFSSGVHAKSLQLKLKGKNSHLQLRTQLKWTLRPPARTIQPHALLQRGEMTGWAFRTTRWRAVWWKVRDECSMIQCEQNIDTLWTIRKASYDLYEQSCHCFLHQQSVTRQIHFNNSVLSLKLNWMWKQKAYAPWNNAKTFFIRLYSLKWLH